MRFSFPPWYASDSFILVNLVKFSLRKKGLSLGLNVYFFDLGKFLFNIQSLLSMFPVNKTNNGFSAANFRILLTNPMTSFCSNLLHLSLKITFSSCNRLIIPYFSLLISSLSSVLTELIELLIFCSKFARASWKSPFLVLVLYLEINQIEQSIIDINILI